MVFSNEDKILIKRLRELKGYGSRRFLREFPTKNWTRRGLDNLLAGRTGSIDRVEGSGHWAHDTVAFLERKTPDFISPTLWPPNSLDLNPVDYIIWSVLQKVYHSRIITGLEELKTSLIDEWAQLDQSIYHWCRCRPVALSSMIYALVIARWAHFEHKFWQCWADMSWN